MSPLRKVPVVMMTACAPTLRPSRNLMPRAVLGAQPGAAMPHGSSSSINSATSACFTIRFVWLSSTSRIFTRYCCLSHCARGDHTAGPREVLSNRNCMPTASVTSPMMPPSASTSRTKCPLAMPPTAGLQDICAIRSVFSVNRAVFSPMRADAMAASQPACPSPTTTTSYLSLNPDVRIIQYFTGNTGRLLKSANHLADKAGMRLTQSPYNSVQEIGVMSSRSGLRKKVVLPVTIIRHNGDQRQLAHTLDLSETSARLGGLSMVLEPGEMVEVQRGQLSAKFQVFWMGAPGNAMEGQAGIRSMEPEKMIWGVPTTEPSEPVTETEVSSAAKLPGEKRWDARLGCSGAASIQPRGSQIPLHGVVKDVSKGGVYVEMMSPLPVNSEVLLKVNISC